MNPTAQTNITLMAHSPFAAVLTAERLFACVNALVIVQVALLVEPFAALATSVRTRVVGIVLRKTNGRDQRSRRHRHQNKQGR